MQFYRMTTKFTGDFLWQVRVQRRGIQEGFTYIHWIDCGGIEENGANCYSLGTADSFLVVETVIGHGN